MHPFIVFDLDGTLMDTIASITHEVNRTFQANGLESLSVETVQTLVGNSSAYLIDHGLNLAGGKDLGKEDRKRILDEYNQNYYDHPIEGSAPYPGIMDLAIWLKDKGRKLGVYSNKPDPIVHRVMDHFFPRGLFDAVSGFREDLPRKPDPTGLLQMIEEAGFKREDTLYIGDSEVDGILGENAGLDTVLVTYGYRESEDLAAFTFPKVDSVEALTNYLKTGKGALS